jgi:hypothetical protein
MNSASGVISDYLADLVETGYIAREHTWHISSGEESKLSHYRLRDNYLRFYLRYIEPNQAAILRLGNIKIPQYSSIMGLQFENLVLNHRQQIYQALGITSEEIIYDNPFFQRATATHPGCQIDLLIQTRFNCLYLCEIKFSKNAVGSQVIQEVKNKISRLVIPHGYSIRPVLITVNGATDAVKESRFFADHINFSDLL